MNNKMAFESEKKKIHVAITASYLAVMSVWAAAQNYTDRVNK